MAIKVLLTTLFIVVEIIVFFETIVGINWMMEKYEVEFTEVGLMISALIIAVLFIGIMISFILYMFF